MISFPNAKINIGLNVVSKRSDGYHNLETIFYPVKLADALEMVPAEKTLLTTSGIKIDGDPENNLVMKAYRIMKKEFGLPDVHFHLHKVVPFGAGLGGGSSDAAFALKMMNNQFNLGLSGNQLEEFAAKMGADCPFFIRNQATFAHGIGDRFEPINLDLSAFQIIVVKPPVSVGTPEAYRNIVPRQSDFDLRQLSGIAIEDWKETVKNDFEQSVFPKYPQIARVKSLLYEHGAVYAAMSGSGSAVFGLFRHLPVDLQKSLPEDYFIYR